jgi:hypothetical protein
LFVFGDIATGNWGALGLDYAGLVLPGATGLGEFSHTDDLSRALTHGDDLEDLARAAREMDNLDEAYDALRYADNFDEAYDAFRYADNVDEAYDALRYSDNFDEVYDASHYADNMDDLRGGMNSIDNIDNPSSFAWYSDCSFTPDTSVATENGEQPIGDLGIGDYILAYDEKTGSTGYYPIEAVLEHNDAVTERVVVDGEEVVTTPEHPFYTAEGGWTDAKDLESGDHLRKADGSYGVVETVTFEDSPRRMYNLTVGTAHTFFVGEGQWLVHNTCKWLGGGFTDDPVGESLAREARAYLNSLDPEFRRTVIAIAQGGDTKIVTAWIGTRSEGLAQLRGLADARGVTFVSPSGTLANTGHAEQVAYRHFSQDTDLRIGISRKRGLCDTCKDFFKSIGFLRIYY